MLSDLIVGEEGCITRIIVALRPEPDHPSVGFFRVMKIIQRLHELVDEFNMVGVSNFDLHVSMTIFYYPPQLLKSIVSKFPSENRVPFCDYFLDRFIKPATRCVIAGLGSFSAFHLYGSVRGYKSFYMSGNLSIALTVLLQTSKWRDTGRRSRPTVTRNAS